MASMMRPDIAPRFPEIVGRTSAKIDRQEAAQLAALRATPLKRISLKNSRKATAEPEARPLK
jgi:hypothetical protein